MCSQEERLEKIKKIIDTKASKKIKKLNTVIEKITVTTENDDKIINKKYIESLPEGILQSIIAYTNESSVNRFLRTKGKSSRSEETHSTMVRNMDIAFRNAPPLTSPITVYRGVRGFDELKDDLGFSSCSLSETISRGFGGGSVFTITVPSGSRVLFVESVSTYPGEQEVILDRCGFFEEIIPQKLTYTSHLYENDF